uniref:Neurabin-2 (Trinotate prediction) n=1 Tax=Myxobolus squamalis TaxID=59785 RepID=A0A6B2FWL5_MYXSQ
MWKLPIKSEAVNMAIFIKGNIMEKFPPKPVTSEPLPFISSQPIKILKEGLFDMKLVGKPDIPTKVLPEQKDSFEEEAGASKTYEFDSNSLLAVDKAIVEFDDVPSIDLVSPLPDSYKVISRSDGRLKLELPPPPKKSVIKKHESKRNKAVKFNDECQVAETYNKEEYERVNEIDVIGSGLEYGFENMLERVTRKSFILHRENNEPLGLNIYGVQVYTKYKDSMAVYVRCVNPDSLCDRCGEFLENDLIIEVNGIDMIGVELSKVSQAIKAGGNDISFVTGRDVTTSIEDASV